MDRRHGFWWSPDSAWLAYAEVDETHIPVYRIVHQGKAAAGEGAQEDHRYPFAGQANARERLGVIAATGGEPMWMDLSGADATLPTAEHEYLARVAWLPNGSLAVQLENRQQTRLDLTAFDPASGQRRLLLSETSDVWINLHDQFKPLKQGGFLWASERSGFRHLYQYQDDGTLLRQVTAGDWMVDELAGVDEERQLVYFTATRESPLERHLYVVPFAGGEPRRITQAPGMHSVTLDHACRRFVDVHDALDSPPSVTLRSLADGAALHEIYARRDPRIDALGLHAPELVTLHNRTGVLLHGALYRPPARFGPGPYPTIVSVYGGPHAQRVVNGWVMTQSMRAQYLRNLGFLVFVLDNRGSARRGLAFESAIKHDMGHAEVEDQVDGVRWLVAHGLADPNRVGIYGWSYGGYMAAMALATAPETFQAAVAGAPVTHWDGYDTHYTERYMGTPETNPRGYERSSVLTHAEGIAGRLLLVHGLIDENVHFRHTARLINALIRARIPYELMLFPDERHMPRRLEDRVFMEERIRDFFLAAL
jgi:dipeptidyl-peptidase-4